MPLHSPTPPSIRTANSKAILTGIIPVPTDLPNTELFSNLISAPSQVNATIVSGPIIYGPHRLTTFLFTTSKGVTGSDVLSVLMGVDRLTDVGALTRDTQLIGTNPNVDWATFQSIPTLITFNELMRRHITVYKFAWRNLTAGAAICTGLIRWER